MKRNRKVKILATLGPASSDEAMIQKLHEAGADLTQVDLLDDAAGDAGGARGAEQA